MQCGIAFIAMSVVVFISLVAKQTIFTFISTNICLCNYYRGLFVYPKHLVREFFISSIGKVSFLSCCVPLLAFAGLSVGGQLEELKKMSWKVILIFMGLFLPVVSSAHQSSHKIGFTIQELSNE